MTRRTRAREKRGRPRVGERFTVDVGPVAHGGHCVARLADGPDAGRVVFVRHAIPGERVAVEVTEGNDGDRFWRADAVEVVDASPDRVRRRARCRAGAVRRLRLPARRALPPAPAEGRGGGRAAAAARRHRLAVRSSRCPATWTGCAGAHAPGSPTCPTAAGHAQAPLARAGARRRLPDRGTRSRGPVDAEVVEAAGVATQFQVAGDGFWQVHPGAPRVLVDTVLALLDPQPGSGCWTCTPASGSSPRSWPTSRAPTGSSRRRPPRAARDAVATCRAAYGSSPVTSPGAPGTLDEPFDLVVLDPPREGARRAVVEQVVDRSPRAVAYVACDPASLARTSRSSASTATGSPTCVPSTCSR